MKSIALIAFVFFSALAPKAYAAGCDFTVGQGEQYTTIQAAVNAAQNGSVAGKTICIKDNKVYAERIVIEGSGAAGSPFTIQKHPDSPTKPKIRDNNPFNQDNYGEKLIHIRSGEYIVLKDLEVERSSGIGIQAYQSDQVQLLNLTVHHTLNAAIKLLETTNSTIENATVYAGAWAMSPECHADPACNAVDDKVPAAVNMIESFDTAIKNCTIYNSYGNVLSSVRSENTVIQNNTVYDSFRPLIHLDQASKVLIENNLVYNTNNPDMPKVTTAFYKLDEFYAREVNRPGGNLNFRTSTGHDRVIKNNIFLNMQTGIQMGACENDMDCVLRNDVIENNTILNIEEYTLAIALHQTVTNNSVKNNIFDAQPDPNRPNLSIANSEVSSGISFGPNIWSKAPPAVFNNAGNIIASTRPNITSYFVYPDKVINQSVLVPGQVDPNWFAVKDQYRQFGADVSTVGANPGSTPSPTPSPSPSTSPSPSPTPTTTPEPSIPGDIAPLNAPDGIVDIFDYSLLLEHFGETGEPGFHPADIVRNGEVDIFDYHALLEHFGDSV